MVLLLLCVEHVIDDLSVHLDAGIFFGGRKMGGGLLFHGLLLSLSGAWAKKEGGIIATLTHAIVDGI